MRVAERSRLSLVLLQRSLRQLASRVAHPLVRWRFVPTKTDRLVIAPQDLRTADATRASEFYAGRFVFAGKIVICDGRSPFELTPISDEWGRALLGFGWLRHLRAADSGITRANARALIDEWIRLHGRWNTMAWRIDVLSRRIMSWLSQAPLVLTDADMNFYRRFLRSLTRQVRFLRRRIDDAPDGIVRLQALIVLTEAALCMAGQTGHLRTTLRRLVDELDRQILPDGGHISRNPHALAELLLDLLPLRQVLSTRNVAPPQAMLNAIDRMMPMLRFFRHGDGNFAHFNGIGPTAPDIVATVLAYDDARGAPVANAPHSGYQRIDSGGSVVLMDTGKPPPVSVSREAHAGCLSFEFSAGLQRIVVNCGLPGTNQEAWREVARATAAHSTVVFNDTSSCRLLESGSFRRLFAGSPIIAGPTDVPVTREAPDGALVVRASHDGYAGRFGVIHQRTLMLTADGSRLEGEDVFLPSEGDHIPREDEFTVRFHLHPAIRANRLTDGHGVMLVLPDRDVWTFSAHEDQIELEESVYLAGRDGPRRTTQIVIYGRARKMPRVRWTFTHRNPTAATVHNERDEQPELPL
ncbi:MAG: heparinase [Rhizobiales bacterium]|nr:heparinase [Hyphomicrobiales bacterium]